MHVHPRKHPRKHLPVHKNKNDNTAKSTCTNKKQKHIYIYIDIYIYICLVHPKICQKIISSQMGSTFIWFEFFPALPKAAWVYPVSARANGIHEPAAPWQRLLTSTKHGPVSVIITCHSCLKCSRFGGFLQGITLLFNIRQATRFHHGAVVFSVFSPFSPWVSSLKKGYKKDLLTFVAKRSFQRLGLRVRSTIGNSKGI